jgi:hypothetical protein
MSETTRRSSGYLEANRAANLHLRLLPSIVVGEYLFGFVNRVARNRLEGTV